MPKPTNSAWMRDLPLSPRALPGYRDTAAGLDATGEVCFDRALGTKRLLCTTAASDIVVVTSSIARPSSDEQQHPTSRRFDRRGSQPPRASPGRTTRLYLPARRRGARRAHDLRARSTAAREPWPRRCWSGRDRASPVMIVLQPGLGYIAALFACFYARLIAVPSFPPRARRLAGTLSAICRDCHPAVILTDASSDPGVAAQLQPTPRSLGCRDSSSAPIPGRRRSRVERRFARSRGPCAAAIHVGFDRKPQRRHGEPRQPDR